MLKKIKNLKKIKGLEVEDVKDIRAKVQASRQKFAEKAYEKAWEALQSFRQVPDVKNLEEAGNKLVEALRYNSEHLKSYYCLAYIFYTLQKPRIALKYLERGESIVKELSPQMQNFKDNILMPLVEEELSEHLELSINKFNKKSKFDKDRINRLKPKEVKAVVNKKSNFVKVISEKLDSEVVIQSRKASKAYQKYIAAPPAIPVYQGEAQPVAVKMSKMPSAYLKMGSSYIR